MIMSRDAAGHPQDLAGGDAAAAVGAATRRWEMIALERAGEHRAHLLVLCGGKKSMMRLIVSVASTVWTVEKHEVAGLGGGQRGVDRLLVAHLADQDHVRVLAQDAAQRALERRGVLADLALVDERALVAVQELDRVLDRDDVLARVSS